MRNTCLVRWLSWTILLTAVAIPPVFGQQGVSAENSSDVLPKFLLPPSPDQLREGLLPLSPDLPDSSARGGLMPPDASVGLFNTWAPASGADRRDHWLPLTKCWCPSELRYRPLYFEDVMLERHGQSRHCLVQPLASGSRYFLSVLALPYKMTLDPPHRPISTLGHFRPGTSAPLLLQRPPLQADAGLCQAGMVVGLIFLIP